MAAEVANGRLAQQAENTGGGKMARKYTVSESVVAAELEDEAVLLNVETGIYFGLDAVGSRIWELLSEGTSDDTLIDRLLAEYEVGADRLRSDVTTFLSELENKGLICAVDSSR